MVKSLRYYHVILGGFLLPVALMFFITGGLYALDFKGGKNTTNWTYQEKGAYGLALDEITDSVSSQFLKKELSLKLTGNPKVKTSKTGIRIIAWKNNSSKIDVTLKESEPDMVVVKVKEPTFFSSFLDLHKVKHGVLYTIYVVIASIALIVLTITGFLMLIQNKLFRRLGFLSALAGTVIFGLLIAI